MDAYKTHKCGPDPRFSVVPLKVWKVSSPKLESLGLSLSVGKQGAKAPEYQSRGETGGASMLSKPEPGCAWSTPRVDQLQGRGHS